MASTSVFMNILIRASSLFCVCFCVVVFETQSAFLSKETLDGKKKSHNMGHIVVELFLFLYHTMWIM